MTEAELITLFEEHELGALVVELEERGTIELAELESIAAALELDDAELEALRGVLEERHVDVRAPVDEDAASARVYESDAVTALPDALQVFLRRAGRHRLLTAADEVALAKRIERGDLTAKERMINANLRLVV